MTAPHRSAALAQSGKQVEIGLGDQRAVIVEVGGGLRTYTAGGREILDGYAADEICTSGRGQLLLPWPNRLEGGDYDFDGRHQLPVDEVTTSSAIHGLVRWATWEIASQTRSAVTLQMVLWPRPGYPFSLALEQEYALDGDGLLVRTTATNIGRNRCPFACGAHPYLTLGSRLVDSLTLCIPASTCIVPNERGLPAGKLAVRGTEFDFTQPRPIGATRLDHAFCDLRRDGTGRAYTELGDSATGSRVTLWQDELFSYLQLFTGDQLPDVARRSIAVEPMTCAPNAFRSGEGLIVLDPGQSFSGQWGISPA